MRVKISPTSLLKLRQAPFTYLLESDQFRSGLFSGGLSHWKSSKLGDFAIISHGWIAYFPIGKLALIKAMFWQLVVEVHRVSIEVCMDSDPNSEEKHFPGINCVVLRDSRVV